MVLRGLLLTFSDHLFPAAAVFGPCHPSLSFCQPSDHPWSAIFLWPFFVCDTHMLTLDQMLHAVQWPMPSQEHEFKVWQ